MAFWVMCNNKMEIVQKYCRLYPEKFSTASGANRGKKGRGWIYIYICGISG